MARIDRPPGGERGFPGTGTLNSPCCPCLRYPILPIPRHKVWTRVCTEDTEKRKARFRVEDCSPSKDSRQGANRLEVTDPGCCVGPSGPSTVGGPASFRWLTPPAGDVSALPGLIQTSIRGDQLRDSRSGGPALSLPGSSDPGSRSDRRIQARKGRHETSDDGPDWNPRILSQSSIALRLATRHRLLERTRAFIRKVGGPLAAPLGRPPLSAADFRPLGDISPSPCRRCRASPLCLRESRSERPESVPRVNQVSHGSAKTRRIAICRHVCGIPCLTRVS